MGYKAHSQVIEAAAPPLPWTVVLERRPLRRQGSTGSLWLRFVSAGEWLLEGQARVTLYRPRELTLEASYHEVLQGSQVYWTDAPRGTFHAVVVIEGYAPAVLPFLDVESEPEESVKVNVSPGIPTVIEIAGTPKSSLLWLTEPSYGLKITDAVVPASSPDVQRLVVRLLPGSYNAQLRPQDRAEVRGALDVDFAQDRGSPSLRMEVQAREGGDPAR